MHVFELQANSAPGSIALTDRPEPRPGPTQVVLEMKAASLNFRDLMIVKGLLPTAHRPMIPLSDGVGQVVAVGQSVTRFKPGDRVAGAFYQNWLAGELPDTLQSLGGSVDGVLAQRVALDQDGLVLVPQHLSDEQAAGLPCAAVTAWNAVMVKSQLKPGSTVLIQGTGGVSLFAIQFALLAGARVIVLSSSDEKLQRVRQMGAHETINYRQTPDWEKEVRQRTGGRGVDCVIEVGGAGTIARSLAAVRNEGQINVIGVLSGVRTEIDIPQIFVRQIRLQGINVGSREMFEQMNAAIASHKIQPVVDRVFPFKESPAAFGYMEQGGYFGKVCIRF